MVEVSTIGLDIAKRVFQVHGVDAAGAIVFRRQLRRAEMVKFFAKLPPCLVGLEACATAHYWGRQIAALGHRVRLMPPTRVKPYVRWGGKNDQADAQACCEAVSRPSMQFVPLKSVPEQVALMTHRARQLLVEQHTQLGNSIRAQMAEMGIIARRGPAGFAALLAIIEHPEDPHLPWVGLVPAQNSTGGKERHGGITKAGDRYLRQLLVVAATGLIPRVRANPEISPWFARLLARMPPRKATVALANKMARIAWALLAKQTTYRAPAAIETAHPA
jgi:transposase